MIDRMNRRDFMRASGFAGLGAALAGWGLSPAGLAQAAEANPDEKYIMVSNVSAHPYWLDAQYGGQDAAAQLGVTWVYTGPADFDTPSQVTALEQLIPTKPAGMIVAALQPDAIGASIDKAIDAGIPVVTVDTDAPASKRLTYLGTANYQAGRDMASAMLAALNGEAGKIGLATVPGQFNLEERIRGIKDVLTEKGGAEIVMTVDDKADDAATADAVVAMLQSHPEINLVSSINAVGAGVAAALRQTNNVGKVKAVTFDITEPIIAGLEDDTIESTMVQRTYMMTYVGMLLLYVQHHPSEYLQNWLDNGLTVLPYAVDTGVMTIKKDMTAPFK